MASTAYCMVEPTREYTPAALWSGWYIIGTEVKCGLCNRFIISWAALASSTNAVHLFQDEKACTVASNLDTSFERPAVA